MRNARLLLLVLVLGGALAQTPAGCFSDLTGDGLVNAVDLFQLLGAWGLTADLADLDLSGQVNAVDLFLLLGDWGTCRSLCTTCALAAPTQCVPLDATLPVAPTCVPALSPRVTATVAQTPVARRKRTAADVARDVQFIFTGSQVATATESRPLTDLAGTLAEWVYAEKEGDEDAASADAPWAKIRAAPGAKPRRSRRAASRARAPPHDKRGGGRAQARGGGGVVKGGAVRAAGDLSLQALAFAGMSNTGATPPDANGAIGPLHFVQAVNGAGGTVGVYGRNGTLLQPISSMMALARVGTLCASGNGDPVATYDVFADRWVFVEFSAVGDALCVYVSTGPSPLGTFFAYQLQAPGFPDYPKLAVWRDCYVISVHEFPDPVKPVVYVLDRGAMLTGAVLRYVRVDLTGVLPGDAYPMAQMATLGHLRPPSLASSATLFRTSAIGALDMLTLDVVWSANASRVTLTPQPSIGLGYTAFAGAGVPQSTGATATLDDLADRDMYPIVYRSFASYEAVYGSRTVRAANNASLASLFFWEVRRAAGTTAWALHHSAQLPNTDGNSRWMPSLGVDSSGNTLLVYSVAGPAVFPGMRAIGRSASDAAFAAPSLAAELVVAAGLAADGGAGPVERWGDYASVALDPVDGCTLWATHQYQGATQWATRVATLRFASCCTKSMAFALSLRDDLNRTQQCGSVTSPLSTPPSYSVVIDPDLDFVPASTDNCPFHWNPQQGDADGDGVGDACDYEAAAPPVACPINPAVDTDGDGVCDTVDNCVTVRNPFQENGDGDAAGGNECDLCPDTCSNGADGNGDGIGDQCSPSSTAAAIVATNSTRVELVDLVTVCSTVTVAGGGTLRYPPVVTLRGSHTAIGDLTMTLTSPSGTNVTLATGNRDLSGWAGRIRFSASAFYDASLLGVYLQNALICRSNGICEYRAAALSTLVGAPASGTWTLCIADSTTGYNGALESWSLHAMTALANTSCYGAAGTDTDSDGWPDSCDTCVAFVNPRQCGCVAAPAGGLLENVTTSACDALSPLIVDAGVGYGNIAPGADVDAFRYQSSQALALSVAVDVLDASLVPLFDSLLSLTTSAGKTYRSDDVLSGVTFGSRLQLCVNAQPSCVLVSSFDAALRFPYTLRVTRLSPARGCALETEPNSNCATATALTFSPARAARATGALANANDTDTYSVTVAAPTQALVSLVAISDQHPLTGLTLTYNGTTAPRQVFAPLLPAGTSCVAVRGAAAADYNLDVDLFDAVPVNNAFAQPTVIVAGTPVTGSNSGATTDAATCGGQPFGADVWYRFVPLCSGAVTVSTCDLPLMDTMLAVYAGTNPGAAPLACNDDACGQQSAVQVSVVAASTYLIRVGGWNGATGVFTVKVSDCA